MVKYQRFHPDLFVTSFNYEAIGVVTSLTGNALQVTGHFRTKGDYVGLRFNSEDVGMHNHVKYKTNKDYTGVKFSFEPTAYGAMRYDDVDHQPSIIIRSGNATNYITLGFLREKRSGIDNFSFDGTIELSQRWITPDENLVASWTKTEMVETTNEKGETVWVEETKTGKGYFGVDFDLDFVRGIVYTKIGAIPYAANVTLDYEYNHGNRYTVDFNKLKEGTHPFQMQNIPSVNIDSITFPVIPLYFESGRLECTGRSDLFSMEFLNMTTVNGDLNEYPSALPKHVYRAAEGFDDEYNRNPKRLIEVMALLGYSSIINLYIGASHFYDKKGKTGYINEGVSTMYLDADVGINIAFETWLHSYLKHMKLNGFTEFICSVSMECLQMPESWKQRMFDGSAGKTGWEPPTSFYSPCNPDVKKYIDRMTKETLDIVVAEGFRPVLQLGESWYWWQEFEPGNVDIPFAGRPPCFYDADTKARFKAEMGYELPIYQTSDIEINDRNYEVSLKLQQFLGEYTVFMKSIADRYASSKFTTLFFPPSVLDVNRVPKFIRTVNSPFEYWKRPNLDFIQIEDYDWITREVKQHEEVFMQPWYDMDYDYSQQHYFAGFVLKHENAAKEWPLIERAAQEALGRGYAEVFIWAGTQIRRDSWVPKSNVYVAECSLYSEVLLEPEEETGTTE